MNRRGFVAAATAMGAAAASICSGSSKPLNPNSRS
ncbi:twin-arginine translocation signal domain-containing protein [Streptomyces sp. NPDC017246]